ncbi:DUF461 domain-containing protein [Streptomyces sp. NPDC059578]|uniref:DUF461 domain-containing protein n=1 Tax=unclassified Streptomyces TaxID=2593676 RepID=UPI0036462B9C
MSSSLRRGALAATAIAFSIASLTACGAGTNAQTLGIKPDNAAVTVGEIQIQNSNIVTQPELEAKGPAAISVTLFNNGDKDQTLDAITLTGSGDKAELKPAKGSGKVTVPAGGSVVIGGKDNASALLPSGRESVKDGDAQNVTYTFSSTGDVKIDSFVVPAASYFEEWGPTEAPAAPGQEASAEAEPSGTGSPAADATGEATGEAAEPADGASSATGSASAPATGDTGGSTPATG